MKFQLSFVVVIISSISTLHSASTLAEVKSLSSSELTDTYIKDSTIIITPKKKKTDTEQTTYSSLTIAPVENNDIAISDLKNVNTHSTVIKTAIELDDELLRNASIEQSLQASLGVEIQTYQERITRPIAEILDDPRYIVPEGNFEYTYIGGANSNELGLSRTDQQLTFSIGNLPGINPIVLPNAIDEGPLQITPRETGGFDLTINIPD